MKFEEFYKKIMSIKGAEFRTFDADIGYVFRITWPFKLTRKYHQICKSHYEFDAASKEHVEYILEEIWHKAAAEIELDARAEILVAHQRDTNTHPGQQANQ